MSPVTVTGSASGVCGAIAGRRGTMRAPLAGKLLHDPVAEQLLPAAPQGTFGQLDEMAAVISLSVSSANTNLVRQVLFGDGSFPAALRSEQV
ncbi:MAG: hypothetical protein JWR80_8782 [Bradyrhizobium sp.]|nr:hypothetical protein [Bradyrhizobium sp.]